jgi:hypothetical protein
MVSSVPPQAAVRESDTTKTERRRVVKLAIRIVL